MRETPEPFVSNVRAALSGRTQALEDLAVELYARGLSTRDIEDAFTDQRGRRLLSRAAVSEITERLWAPYHWLDFTPARSQIAPLQRPTLSAPRTEGRMRVHRTRWVIQPPQNRLEKKSVGRSKPD